MLLPRGNFTELEVLYAVRRNAVPESLWRPPQAFKWMFSRLLNRCWSLKRIAVMESSRPISFGTSEGARFVAWEITAGAEVAFR